MNLPLWILAAALTGTPQSPAPSKPSMKRETAYGLLMGGTAVVLLMTWAGGMAGATLLDRDGPGDRDVGKVLPIPVAGPFIAASNARAAGDDGSPLYAMMGVQQLAASGVLTAGAIGVSQHHAYDRHQGTRHDLSRSSATTMIATGLTGAGIVYGLTLGLTNEPRRRGQRFGRRFAIPLFGGIAAAPLAPSYRAGVGALTSSALQIAGVGIAATGIALSVRSKRRAQNVVVLPVVGRGQALLTATVQF